MAIQHVLPSGGYLNETGANQYGVPGSGYVNETVAPPPVSNSFSFAKRRNYYIEPYPERWYFIQKKARSIVSGFVPPPPAPLPFISRHKQAFLKPIIPARLKVPRAKQISITSVPPPIFSMLVDGLVREILVTNDPVATIDGLVREVLVQNTGPLLIDGLVREILGSTPPGSGPIPLFPALPYGFPVKVTPMMATIIGTNPSARETRRNMQDVALWEIEILFEELRDQTQNVVPDSNFLGFTQYMQLVQLWLTMYGQGGQFAFDAPWDNSREDQVIATGDGFTNVFTIVRTWGQDPNSITEPVGLTNEVFDVSWDGVTVNPADYQIIRNKIYFIVGGLPFPPPVDTVVTMTFSYYYVCRFIENNQDFEEFSLGRWTVPSLKFQSLYWP